MKKLIQVLLFAVGLLGFSNAANAQCSGQFSQNQFCGYTGTGKGLPGPVTLNTPVLIPIPALTVVGNPTNAPALATTIPGTANQVLRVNGAGTALAFGAVDLSQSAAVTGNLAVSHLNSGTGASSTTYWRGDGTWGSLSASGSFAATAPLAVSFPATVVTYALDYDSNFALSGSALSFSNALTMTGRTLTGGSYTGATINNTPVGPVTPSTGTFTTLSSNSTTAFTALTANRLVATGASSILGTTITSANVALSVSDETGSGLLVFNSAPSLSAPIISGGTIDGAVIGGTTPAAGTFSSLNDTGLTASRVVGTDASQNLVASFTSAALAASLTNETGSGLAVFNASPSISNLTVTGSLTATGLVTNADLVNASTTVNGTTCTLGSTCTIVAAAALTVGTTTVSSGTTGFVLTNNGGTLGNSGIASLLSAGTGVLITGTTTAGIAVDTASTANIWAATANKILDAGNVFNAAGALQACTGTSTAACDFGAGFNFSFTATSATNYTLANPTSPKVGQQGCIYLSQPASGTVVTITFGSNWNTAGGVSGKALTATLGAIDRVCYLVRTTSFIDFTLANNLSH